MIDVAIAQVMALIVKYSPGLLADAGLAPFTRFGKAFVGQLPGDKAACWVGPRTVQFDPEGQLTDSGASITVTIGVSGGDPETLMDAAMGYVIAVHRAIESATPAEFDVRVLRIFIGQHDFGPLWGKGAGFAAFPCLHLIVDMTEEV